MELKQGVQLAGMQPEMLIALLVITPILSKNGQELVITSAVDSKHSRKSRHYIGYGIDVRSRDIPEDAIETVTAELSSALGSEFYVAFEKDHFHIQFNGTARV